MHKLQRNQLVWLGDAAWQTVLQQPWDAQASELLRHWRGQQLPLVVCRQRNPDAHAHISLGLPAPAQWGRRKLALDVAEADIARVGHFPLLTPDTLAAPDAAQLAGLLAQTQALGVSLRVYGSHGWQQLCGLPCVREGSDLDLEAAVPDLDTAAQLVWLLQGLSLGCRVDGELVFPNGWAIAWREYAQLIGGKVAQVLVKERAGVQLLDMAGLRRALRRPVQPTAQQIARCAVRALYSELSLEPKPGLVSFRDNGSHSDMTASTFVKSLFALRHYFAHAARAGQQGLPFAALQTLGLEAERRMLLATAGVNTHRGAIFSLGLLCAAAGLLAAQGRAFTPRHVRTALLAQWGEALRQRAQAAKSAAPVSQGQRAARRFQLRSANDEAAAGFPTLFEVTLPALQAALAQGQPWRSAKVHCLFATMGALDDTNVAHRGGQAGMGFVKDRCARFLAAGSVAQRDWLAQARHLHAEFVARRLSPGGAADVMACAIWMQDMQSALAAAPSTAAAGTARVCV